MTPEQLRYRDGDTWTWNRARAMDVADIVIMAEQHYQREIDAIIVASPAALTYNLHRACVEQLFKPESEMVSVARDKLTNQLLAWAWVTRGSYTAYSADEMATAEFIHTDLDLNTRSRCRLVGQAIESWILWCELHAIPVLVSTSIRDEYAGFMRIHTAYGFETKGSYAYRRIRSPHNE